MASKTQVVTGKVRFSYVNVFQPREDLSGDLKYSVTLLIPKTDKATLAKIKAAIAAAKESFRTKAGKPLPPNAKTTLHDGDGTKEDGSDYGPECAGNYVITVSSKNPPVIVDADKNEIMDTREVYSGCYGRAIINFYGFDVKGNRGISAGLNGIMKLHDGEPLGGSVVTDADWDDGWEDEEPPFDEDDDIL